MNTATTHRTATALATAAAAGALTIVSLIAPTAASAHRPDPVPDPVTTTRCAESAGGSSIGSMDIDEIVTMLKVRRAKYLFDHPLLIR